MSALLKLSALAMRGLVFGACHAVGLEAGDRAVEPVTRFLGERFGRHGTRLLAALERANDRAWGGLEFALAGRSAAARLPGPALLPPRDRAGPRAVPGPDLRAPGARRRAARGGAGPPRGAAEPPRRPARSAPRRRAGPDHPDARRGHAHQRQA